jgi:DNA-binding beta-propeller fold protein YncE
MKKFALWCGLLALAGAAFFVGEAGAYKLLGSFPTPGPEPRGISFDGGHCIVDDGPDGSYVYQVDFSSGSIYSSFPAPGGSGAWGVSLGAELGQMFVSNYETSWIYQVTRTGSLLGSFLCPLPHPADMETSYRDELHIAIPDHNLIAVVDARTGSFLRAYAGPGTRPTSVGGYGCHLIADADEGKIWYTHYHTWVLTGFENPTGVTGFATIDTRSIEVFYVVDAADDTVYVWGSEWVAVAPASLGRVKALFR